MYVLLGSKTRDKHQQEPMININKNGLQDPNNNALPHRPDVNSQDAYIHQTINICQQWTCGNTNTMETSQLYLTKKTRI